MRKLPFKLYKGDGFEGYDSKDIEKHLGAGSLASWRKWYIGSTGAILDGKFIVYRWDFENWLAGRPNLD